jgi:hypothetical protein
MSRPPGSGEKRLPRFPAELSFLFLFPYLPLIYKFHRIIKQENICRINLSYQVSYFRVEAVRVWVNCYHLYPAHATFGGYKQSGIGHENHKMMLEHYLQTKSLIISYDKKPTGLF